MVVHRFAPEGAGSATQAAPAQQSLVISQSSPSAPHPAVAGTQML
jgi:hypothetical protein